MICVLGHEKAGRSGPRRHGNAVGRLKTEPQTGARRKVDTLPVPHSCGTYESVAAAAGTETRPSVASFRLHPLGLWGGRAA